MNRWTRPFEWTSASAAPAEGAPSRGEPRHQQYFAFLSYSHADTAEADWLHKELERFHVPSSLAGRLTPNGVVPKRLTPIFRDRHELPAADDLGAEIRQAIAASRCMIVLCSPSAARSKWTNAEIETFKRVHPEGCIVAGIVSGEPFASEMPGREQEECFPPALRRKYDKRGHATGKRAEPLAADLREGGDGRRLGFLKIVAGMLGVGLDDLVQREQLRRQRRMAYIAAGSLVGMVVTSTLAVTAIQARDEAREQRSEAEDMVGFMLGDLRDKLEPLGRLDTLDAVGARALAYYEKQDKSDLSDEALAQRARALTLMGEIAQTRGDLDRALRLYREAFASTAEAVRRYPEEPQRLFDHAQNVYWLGYIAYQRGQLDKAGARFGQYKNLAEQMVALAPDNNEYRRETVYANTNLGTVLMEEQRYREAAKLYEASLRGAEAVAAAEPQKADYQRSVSNNLGWLADAYEFSGDLDRALAARERQVRLLEDLEQGDARDTSIQRYLVTAYRAIGRLNAAQGDAGSALAPSLKGVAIAESLIRLEPGNTEWLQASANNHFDLAEVQLAAGRSEEAAATIRAGCEQVDRLLQRDSSVVNWKSMKRVWCLTLLGRSALRDGSPERALSLAREALKAANLATKPTEKAMLQLRALAAASDALKALGRHEEAASVARQALGAASKAAELIPAEKAIVAVLQIRTGQQAEAQRTMTALTSMGYRHPTFVKQIRTERAQ